MKRHTHPKPNFGMCWVDMKRRQKRNKHLAHCMAPIGDLLHQSVDSNVRTLCMLFVRQQKHCETPVTWYSHMIQSSEMDIPFVRIMFTIIFTMCTLNKRQNNQSQVQSWWLYLALIIDCKYYCKHSSDTIQDIWSPMQTKDSRSDDLKLAAACNKLDCDVMKTCQFTPMQSDETVSFNCSDSSYLTFYCRLYGHFVAWLVVDL